MKSFLTKFLVLISLTLVLASGAFAQQSTTQQAAAPGLTPNPEWTHQKLGAFVYPAKGQKPEQQKKDETECYTWAQSQTGIDLTAPPTAPAAPATTAKTENPAEGARVKGAARGAAGGAVIGAIAGDAGTGAAIGAAAGTMRGGAQKRRAQRAAKKQQEQAADQAQQQAAAAEKQKVETFKKAYFACVQGRGYTAK